MTALSLLFRTDASSVIGGGHMMRCLALAQAALDAGHSARFLTAQGAAGFAERWTAEGIEMIEVPVIPGSEEDRDATAECACDYAMDWLVLDGYHFGAGFQRGLAGSGLRVALIDDWGNAGACLVDLVIDQNVAAAAADYPDCRAGTKRLLGTEYALLRREFRNPGDKTVNADERLHILVTLGAADEFNVSDRVIQALNAAGRGSWRVRIIVGPANPNIDALKSAAEEAGDWLELVYAPPDMAALVRWADLTITAGGSTLWELAHAGVAMLIVAIADNQIPNARRMADLGAAIDLGWHADLDAPAIGSVLENLAADPQRRAAMGEVARQLVDGHGAPRVLEHLIAAHEPEKIIQELS